MTDNPTRTVADVRHAFTKNGGNLGTSGAVAYMFTRVGQIFFETGDDAALEERILEAALEAGADDVVSEDGWTEEIGRAHVRTPVPNAHLVCRLLLEKKK